MGNCRYGFSPNGRRYRSGLRCALLPLHSAFLKLNIIELGAQEAEGLFLILKLGFLRLAVDYDSCGNMGKTHGRVCGIYTLPAVSGGTHYVDAAVIHIDLYVYILSLRHHGYRRCGSMDSSAGLCLRHTLYPVHAALVFQLEYAPFPVTMATTSLKPPIPFSFKLTISTFQRWLSA